jgi:hypothetical protein
LTARQKLEVTPKKRTIVQRGAFVEVREKTRSEKKGQLFCEGNMDYEIPETVNSQ